ncbi:MAG: class I SAM-dependent methyltransferase [Flavipsychrobacter sp.]
MSSEYYHTKESVEEYIKLSEGYDGAYLIKELMPLLPIGSTVLELGSGSGKDIELLSQYYKVTGSDYSEEFLKVLKNRLPNVDFLHLNAATLVTDLCFNCIYSNKVLHHLKDEELTSSISRQHELLNRDGIVCHSFWKGEGSELFKGMFVNYHTKKELGSLFATKFNILHLEEYAEVEEGDSIFLIAQKK